MTRALRVQMNAEGTIGDSSMGTRAYLPISLKLTI